MPHNIEVEWRIAREPGEPRAVELYAIIRVIGKGNRRPVSRRFMRAALVSGLTVHNFMDDR